MPSNMSHSQVWRISSWTSCHHWECFTLLFILALAGVNVTCGCCHTLRAYASNLVICVFQNRSVFMHFNITDASMSLLFGFDVRRTEMCWNLEKKKCNKNGENNQKAVLVEMSFPVCSLLLPSTDTLNTRGVQRCFCLLWRESQIR